MRILVRMNPDVEIYLIPNSDIYAEIGRQLEITPVTINGVIYDDAWDLYRDPIHGNKYGGYSSGLAIYASLFPMDRSSMNVFTTSASGFRYGPESNWTPEMYSIFRDAVYDCLQTVPFARRQQ
jgi:hypothetical protein